MATLPTTSSRPEDIPAQHIKAAIRLRPLLASEVAREEFACLSLVSLGGTHAATLSNSPACAPAGSSSSASSTDVGGVGYGIRACAPVAGAEGSLHGPHLRPAVAKGVESVRARAALSSQHRLQDFSFDLCLGPAAGQLAVFDALCIREYCDDAIEGRAATVLCFGQTGSGKTFTLSGGTLVPPPATASPSRDVASADESSTPHKTGDKEKKRKKGKSASLPTPAHAVSPATPDAQPHLDGPMVAEDGLQYRAVEHLVQKLHSRRDDANVLHATLKCSYVELYNESIHDLLQGTSGLRCRWSAASKAFFVEDCLLVECESIEDFLLVLREGQACRHRAGHLLNEDSSRSHVIFTIYCETSYRDGSPSTYGKLTFVDLAGSERLSETGSDGEDTKSINTSLFALGHVIECLSRREKAQTVATTAAKTRKPTTKKGEFIPYRSSVLTQLLMDSLGGQCRTLMVACVTPSSRFYEESLKTLRYAQRMRCIATTAARRVDLQEAARFEMQKSMRAAQRENAAFRKCLGLPVASPDETEPLTESAIAAHLKGLLEMYAQAQLAKHFRDAPAPAAAGLGERKPTSAPAQGRQGRLSRSSLDTGGSAAPASALGRRALPPLPLSPPTPFNSAARRDSEEVRDEENAAQPVAAPGRQAEDESVAADPPTLEVDMGDVEEAPEAAAPPLTMPASPPRSTARPPFSVLDLLNALPDTAAASPAPSHYGFRSSTK